MYFTKPARGIQRVFVHCSASDNPAHDNIETMIKWHLARGFNGVGYHYFISKDGTIHLGRPLNRTPAAQGGHNTGTIAICLHGLKKDKFTQAQFDSLKKLALEIDKEYHGNMRLTFHGHREVANRTCPVFDYKKVLGIDAKGHINIGVNNETDDTNNADDSFSLFSFLARIFARSR